MGKINVNVKNASAFVEIDHQLGSLKREREMLLSKLVHFRKNTR